MPARIRPVRSKPTQMALFDEPSSAAATLDTAAAASAEARLAAERTGSRRSPKVAKEIAEPPPRLERAKARSKGDPERARESADSMAARQRDISISEFFTKNRHLLG